MNGRKFFLIAAVMLVAGLCSQNAIAVPVGGVLDTEYTGSFDIAGGSGIVDSKVYSYGSGEYVYSYEIANSSGVGISFFSVAISPGADAYDSGIDAILVSDSSSTSSIASAEVENE